MASIWGRSGEVPVLFVGVHHPHWLSRGVLRHPAMVSRAALEHARRRTPWPRSDVEWALDSGAFSAWRRGGWKMHARQWCDEIRRYSEEIGRPVFTAGMDWPVFDEALAASGKSVEYHMAKTVENYQELHTLLDRDDDPYLLPTIQGRDADEYERCLFAYLQAGVDLCRAPLVGAGSLAGGRRHFSELTEKVALLGEWGVGSVHAFGVYGEEKLGWMAHRIVSADSMAWSVIGKRMRPHSSCRHQGRSENNCANWSQQWADEMLGRVRHDVQARHLCLQWVQRSVDGEHGWEPEAVETLREKLAELEEPSTAPAREKYSWRVDARTAAPTRDQEQLCLF